MGKLVLAAPTIVDITPVPHNEDERLAALRALKIAGTPRSADFDAVTALAASMFDCSFGHLSLVEADQIWLKSEVGLGVDRAPRAFAFCNVTVSGQTPLVLEDASVDPRFAAYPSVTGPPFIRAYAGIPIQYGDGLNIGSFCVFDSKPRSWSEKDIRNLTAIGRVIEQLVASHARMVAASEAMRERETVISRRSRLLAQTERMAQIGGWGFDLETNELSWSDQVFRLHELPIGMTPPLDEALSFYPESARAMVAAVLQRTAETGEAFDFETDFITAEGTPRRVRSIGELETEDGRPTRLIGMFQDVTEEHEIRERLLRSANYDFLTGIANRELFQATLAMALTRAREARRSTALLLVDLDRFKELNDSLGHQAGDAVLKEVARRLSQMPRGDVFVARLGGDEFAIIMRDASGPSAARDLARELIDSLGRPIDLGEGPVNISATIGAALYPGDASSDEQLMTCADVALYQAKQSAPGSVGFFVPATAQLFDRRRRAIEFVRGALENDRLVPFYQPKVRLRDGTRDGFEALARVIGVDGIVTGPPQFAAALADPETARRIGDRMLHQVTADLVEWRKRGIDPGIVSINATHHDFARGDFPARVLGRLTELDLPNGQLMIEVTETTFLGDDTRLIERELGMLHQAGVQIAFDDFGTGFASLTHLRDYPIDWLKIDQSFVADLGRTPDNALIIKSVIDLGHGLGMTIVAEGIETEEQLRFLRTCGCDCGQGYLFGKAKPFEAAMD